jgi:hypothetical protein
MIAQRLFNIRSTLLSRLPVNFSNSLRYLISVPRNLQASCKHDASTAPAMRSTSDFISDIRPSIDRDLLARLGGRLTLLAGGIHSLGLLPLDRRCPSLFINR